MPGWLSAAAARDVQNRSPVAVEVVAGALAQAEADLAVEALAFPVGGDALWRRLLAATALGAVAALLRWFGGLVQDTLATVSRRPPGPGMLYDVRFVIAGIVFYVAARGLRRSPGKPGRA